MEHYERFIQGKISREGFRAVQDIANKAQEALIQVEKRKNAYEKQYAVFRKLLSANRKDIRPMRLWTVLIRLWYTMAEKSHKTRVRPVGRLSIKNLCGIFTCGML